LYAVPVSISTRSATNHLLLRFSVPIVGAQD
jgi:hypothetical protein